MCIKYVTELSHVEQQDEIVFAMASSCIPVVEGEIEARVRVDVEMSSDIIALKAENYDASINRPILSDFYTL